MTNQSAKPLPAESQRIEGVPTLPYLSPTLLARLPVTTAETIACIERLIHAQRQGRVWCAPKAVVHPGDGRYIMATLAVADEPRVVATKSLVLSPRNSERGLEVLNSLVTLLDSETGRPLAVLDGNWVTAKRTAGLSAVAATRLARPDSKNAAFIGCGVQARSHMEAFHDLFPLEEIRAFGRGPRNRDALCLAAAARGLRAIASPSARDAVEGADIVVTSVTLMPDLPPFLDARWLKPGAFAAVTDLGIPWRPDGMSAFDRIVIDDREQEAKMSKPMVDARLVAGDLAGLVCGDLVGRLSAEERTAFVFRGLAIGDLALASHAYERAAAAGLVQG